MSYTFLKFRNEYNHEKVSGIVKEEVASSIISFVRFLTVKYEICSIVNNIKFGDIVLDLEDDEILEFIKELIYNHSSDCYDDFANLEGVNVNKFKEICINVEKYFKLNIVSRFEMFFN